MPTASLSIQERRRFPRQESPGRMSLDLVHPPLTAESINFSEGGLCLRLRQMLEVRSLVRLQLTRGSFGLDRRRLLTCTGRVTWVMQRLDLRDAPPFVFDTGIEFVDPPPAFRQLIAQHDPPSSAGKPVALRQRALAQATIRGRLFMPHLERISPAPAPARGGPRETRLPVSRGGPTRPLRWHLVVSVEGIPCFSEHYPSERAAVSAWATFKRQQAKR